MAYAVSKHRRKFILERDNFTCLKCQLSIPTENYDGSFAPRKRSKLKCIILELDHIIPQSLGGSNELNNLQTLCNSCNSKKRGAIKDYRGVV